MYEENSRKDGNKEHEVAHEHGRADTTGYTCGSVTLVAIFLLPDLEPAAGGAETLAETLRRPEIDPPIASQAEERYAGRNVDDCVPALGRMPIIFSHINGKRYYLTWQSTYVLLRDCSTRPSPVSL